MPGSIRIPIKAGEVEVPQEWIDEWNKVYYNVPQTIMDARMWCLDNPSKRKTRRGLRAFLGRWIRNSCTKRPQEQPQRLVQAAEPVQPLHERLSRLAELKGALKRGETP